MAKKRTVRVVLNEENFRKYKAYCAIEDLSMTEQTNILIKNFIDKAESFVKIIKIDKNGNM